MKLLLITGEFPPYTVIGAIRTGKLASYFHDQGHDIQVITASGWRKLISVPVEIPEQRIRRTKRINLNFLPELFYGGKEKIVRQGYIHRGSLSRRMAKIYRNCVHIPDQMAGWIPFAVAEARRLLSEWKPDLIYCSGMPFSGFIIGYLVSRSSNIPWVAEYRDLWSQNAFYEYMPWRRTLDRIMENCTVRSARALVTVSPTLAEKLKNHFNQPIAVIYNGFDPADYANLAGIEQRDDKILKIVYTGTIYQDFQDIRPLFQAISMLDDKKKDIEIHVFSTYIDSLVQAAIQYGVNDCLKTHELIPYRDALQTQRQADILLHLGWNDPSEKGFYTGKLFGYLGARRPILSVGLGDDLPSDLIRQRQAGFTSNDPEAIARQLTAWLDQKASQGNIPDLPASVGAGFTRQEQFARLESFLLEILAGKAL